MLRYPGGFEMHAPLDSSAPAHDLGCVRGRQETEESDMYMRIIWGRIVAGQWDGFEAAYKKATSLRGNVKGLKNQWLARDQGDPDAGYSITLWDSEADMRAFWDSKKREEAMALLRPFFLNQFTVTQCEVRSVQHE
jgi:heme-degrading monooxygenase HmoA